MNMQAARAQRGSVLTVTPNPALDMTWRVASVRTGESHRVPTAFTRAGGKGLNVARVLHAQGIPVRAVTTVGGDTGIEFATELARSGVPHRLVRVAAATRRSVAIVDEGLGDTTIFNELGITPSPAEWADLLTVLEAELPHASALVVSGSVPPNAPEQTVQRLVTAGLARGLPVIADTSGAALLEAARAGATLVKPNAAELSEATGESDPLMGAAALLQLGAGSVLCSLGPEGMLLVTREASGALRGFRAQPPRVLAGNPTGAGDAAVAAVAAELSGGSVRPEALLIRATAWSAAAVLMPFAGDISPTHPEIAKAVTVQELMQPLGSGKEVR